MAQQLLWKVAGSYFDQAPSLAHNASTTTPGFDGHFIYDTISPNPEVTSVTVNATAPNVTCGHVPATMVIEIPSASPPFVTVNSTYGQHQFEICSPLPLTFTEELDPNNTSSTSVSFLEHSV